MKTETKVAIGVTGSLVTVATVVLLTRPVAAALAQVWAGEDIVVATPEHDKDKGVLIWGVSVLQKFAQAITAPYALLATADNLRAAIIEIAPERFYGLGHGFNHVYTCEHLEPFLRSDGLNLDLVEERYIHLLSCLTAKDLGYRIIEAGAKGYFGYYEEFTFCVLSRRPTGCRYEEACFYGDVEIELCFANGERDLEIVYNASINRFNEEIGYWEEHWEEETCNGTPINEAMAQAQINCLIQDRDGLSCYMPPPGAKLRLIKDTYQQALAEQPETEEPKVTLKGVIIMGVCIGLTGAAALLIREMLKK